MTYQESLDFLFQALPMFQRVGGAAFKKDLGNTFELCKKLDNPQSKFKSIHVGGTNGKGSTAHALASILQKEGYKTGLYTSPHLKSFRERIKINGLEIPEAEVVSFVSQNKGMLLEIKPSFFEMTVALAFDYFAREKVDFAVIEVGMGGRFDSTNVIQPELCIITNIGLDHEQFLGNTLPLIAMEKAGIIKAGIPVIIGQTHPETKDVFTKTGRERQSPVYFADQEFKITFKGIASKDLACFLVEDKEGLIQEIEMDLLGAYQAKNLPALLKSFEILNSLNISIQKKNLLAGLKEITSTTGLKGRWQTLSYEPLIICDTGHNMDGMKVLLEQIKSVRYQRLYMVLGMVKDKDADKILEILPSDAYYIFCQPDLPRALSAEVLLEKAKNFDLQGESIPDVNNALDRAKMLADKGDFIFVGGSTFVVAEINEL